MAALLQRPGNKIFYIQYSLGGKKRRVSTGTDVLQIAKEKLRQFESAQANGSSPLPSRTPIPDVVGAYARFMRSTKTFKSAMTDIYYLRQIFGAVCPELKVTTTRKRSPQKRPVLADADRRHKLPLIEAKCFEAITSAQVSQFITAHVDARGLAPKTAIGQYLLNAFFNGDIAHYRQNPDSLTFYQLRRRTDLAVGRATAHRESQAGFHGALVPCLRWSAPITLQRMSRAI